VREKLKENNNVGFGKKNLRKGRFLLLSRPGTGPNSDESTGDPEEKETPEKDRIPSEGKETHPEKKKTHPAQKRRKTKHKDQIRFHEGIF